MRALGKARRMVSRPDSAGNAPGQGFSCISRTMRRASLLVAVAALAASPQGTHAQVEERESAEEEFPRHVVGLFLGNTSEDRRSEDRRDGFTLGLEYEYRASAPWGIGVSLEHVGGDIDSGVVVLPVARHFGHWKVYAGPGLERREEEEEALFRLGMEYGFRVREIEVSPQVNVDFVDGERLFALGVVFAWEL